MTNERCARCGHDYTQYMTKCRNCHTRFWCEWDADWYLNRFTRASIGQSPTARVVGNYVLGLTLIFVAYAALVHLGAAPSERDLQGLLVFGGGICFFAYEVWAFTHGRTTTIDHFRHGPTPKNTEVRVLGLALDILFLLFLMFQLVSG